MISLPSVWFPGLLEKEENFEISLSRLAHTACYTMWIPHSLIFFFSKRNQHSRWAFSATNRQQKGKLNRVFRNSKSKSGGVQVRETIKEENSNKIWIKQNLLKDFRNDGNEKNYEFTLFLEKMANSKYHCRNSCSRWIPLSFLLCSLSFKEFKIHIEHRIKENNSAEVSQKQNRWFIKEKKNKKSTKKSKTKIIKIQNLAAEIGLFELSFDLFHRRRALRLEETPAKSPRKLVRRRRRRRCIVIGRKLQGDSGHLLRFLPLYSGSH